VGGGKDVGKPQLDLHEALGKRIERKTKQASRRKREEKRGGQHASPSTKIAAFKVFLLFFILKFFVCFSFYSFSLVFHEGWHDPNLQGKKNSKTPKASTPAASSAEYVGAQNGL